MALREEKSYRYTSDFKFIIRGIILCSLGFYYLAFIVPIVAKIYLNANGVEIGMISSVQVLGIAISSPLVGAIADRSSRTKLILIGSFGRGSAYFFVYLGFILKSISVVACGTFTIGFMVGFFWIPINTLIADKSNKKYRSYAYGKRDSATGKGGLIGAVLGFSIFILGNLYIPNNLFIIYIAIPVFGIANFIAGLIFLKNLDEKHKFFEKPHSNGLITDNSKIYIEETEEHNEGLGRTTKNSMRLWIGMILLLIVLLMATINSTIARPFLQLYILQYIINDPNIALFIYVPPSIIALFFSPKLGELVDKIRPSIGITVISIFGALNTWFLINTKNPFLFSVLLTLDNAIFNTAALIIMNFISRISLKNRGKIIGLQSVFSYLGGVIGPIFGGLAWDAYGMKYPFIISIIVELVLIPIYLIAIRFVKPYLAETYESKEPENLT